ncbi:Cysteine-rich secretory protein family protein [Caloramator mitchellensis]|uniref:Cysteine-rich secretory protein family protein n=2 Tax=Caloramator mitchellensis TaxID=908809 RepID=A0A0R3K407_CALMK|nr:Cysteine-rich secretory protein family protein [Caloramator mitchellensis]
MLGQTLARGMVHSVNAGCILYKISAQNGTHVLEILKTNSGLESTSSIYFVQKDETNVVADIRTLEKEVVRLVNIERAKAGLKPLKENTYLSKVARIKSQDMINKGYFSHYSPTYGSPFNMMKKFGIKYIAAGENIAMGQRTPREVMNAWMASAGHRRNILNPTFTQIGVGVAKSASGRIYWTQMFIRP